MSQAPKPDQVFVAIDLDNLSGYRLSDGPETPAHFAVTQMLLQIEQHIASIQEGFAAMNSRTKAVLPEEILNILNRWQIRVIEVPTRPEAADKDIFYAIGRAGGRGFRRMVIVSKDKGFAEAAQRLRDDYPTMDIFVVLDQVTGGVSDIYSCVDNVQFLELAPSGSSKAVLVPHPSAEPSGKREAANPPHEPRGASPPAPPPPAVPSPAVENAPVEKPKPPPTEKAPSEPQGEGPAPLPARVKKPIPQRAQDDYVLVCDYCGWRAVQHEAGKNSLCRCCGSAMRTARVFSTRVVPPGKRPFDDGPVIELWVKKKLRRTAVLCAQSMTFGRNPDPSRPENFVQLGDLVAVKNRISREQFVVVQSGNGRCELIPRGDRLMFLDEKGEQELPQDERLELKNGQELWINDPTNPNDTGALIRCVFLTSPRPSTSS